MRYSIIKKYYKFWLPFLSVLILFGIIEIFFRTLKLTEKFNSDFKFYIRHVDNDLRFDFMVEDPLLMWNPKRMFNDGHIIINSHGFRDREYETIKPRNVFRILCLGDSSTFGLGVEQAMTYHAMLEEKLNQNLSHRNLQFEVINGGCTGYTSAQGLNLYKYKGKRYKPDIVTFYFGINDPICRFHLNDKQIMQNHLPRLVKVLTNQLLLKMHFYRCFRKILLDIRIDKNNLQIQNVPHVPRVSLDDFHNNILELNELCISHGSKLVFISPPLCKEKVKNWDRTKQIILYKKELKNISKKYNIPLLTVKKMSEEAEGPTVQFFTDTVHPNRLGHKILMKNLYSFLVNSDLIQKW